MWQSYASKFYEDICRDKFMIVFFFCGIRIRARAYYFDANVVARLNACEITKAAEHLTDDLFLSRNESSLRGC